MKSTRTVYTTWSYCGVVFTLFFFFPHVQELVENHMAGGIILPLPLP